MFIQLLLAQQNRICGFGPLGLCDKPANSAPQIFDNAVSKIIGALTVLAVLWFIFQFFVAGFKWISAGGDPKKVEDARNRITHAVMGLVIIFVALVIIQLIAELLGIPDLLDLDNMINKIML